MSDKLERNLVGSLSTPQTVTGTISIGKLSGGTNFSIDGHTLKLNEEGKLSVNTTDTVEKDNTLPITSAAVHTQIGNIETILNTI